MTRDRSSWADDLWAFSGFSLLFGMSVLHLREQVHSGSQIILLQTGNKNKIKLLGDACRSYALFWLESSKQLSIFGEGWATWPDCLQKPESIVWFHADSCSWCLRKEMCCPPAWMENCLIEERNKRMSCNWKKISCMPKPHSLEQLGHRSKGFRCFLTFGGSFQTTGEFFSSFLTAPVR